MLNLAEMEQFLKDVDLSKLEDQLLLYCSLDGRSSIELPESQYQLVVKRTPHFLWTVIGRPDLTLVSSFQDAAFLFLLEGTIKAVSLIAIQEEFDFPSFVLHSKRLNEAPDYLRTSVDLVTTFLDPKHFGQTTSLLRKRVAKPMIGSLRDGNPVGESEYRTLRGQFNQAAWSADWADKSKSTEVPSTAFLMSGGGPKAFLANINAFREMKNRGMLNLIRDQGGVSGGAWLPLLLCHQTAKKLPNPVDDPKVTKFLFSRSPLATAEALCNCPLLVDAAVESTLKGNLYGVLGQHWLVPWARAPLNLEHLRPGPTPDWPTPVLVVANNAGQFGDAADLVEFTPWAVAKCGSTRHLPLDELKDAEGFPVHIDFPLVFEKLCSVYMVPRKTLYNFYLRKYLEKVPKYGAKLAEAIASLLSNRPVLESYLEFPDWEDVNQPALQLHDAGIVCNLPLGPFVLSPHRRSDILLIFDTSNKFAEEFNKFTSNHPAVGHVLLKQDETHGFQIGKLGGADYMYMHCPSNFSLVKFVYSNEELASESSKMHNRFEVWEPELRNLFTNFQKS